MRKGTLIAIGVGVAATSLLIAPDAWATTGFTTIDQALNKVLTAITGVGGVAGAGGVVEAVTGWRFGRNEIITSGGKTAVMGGGIGGAPAISTTVIGTGSSFTGLTMLPTAAPWLHSIIAWIS